MPKKIIKGTVTSTGMEKTIVVSVVVQKRHPVYKKIIRETKKFKARDELGTKVGNAVAIEECRPFSKTVTWKVVEIFNEEKK